MESAHTSGMNHTPRLTAFTAQSQSVTALWPLLIFHPTEGTRLSWSAGAPAPRGQRGQLALYYNTSHIIHQKSKSIYSASISHNTDLVKLSQITALQKLTSEAQELPVYLNLHNRNSPAPITKVTKVLNNL